MNKKHRKIEKMKIRVKKVLNKNGDEMYHIIEVIGVADRTMLPQEYLQGDHVVLDRSFPDGRKAIHLSRGKSILEGSNMTRLEFEASLMFVHKCGNRLHDIQKKIVERRKNWKGTEEFEI